MNTGMISRKSIALNPDATAAIDRTSGRRFCFSELEDHILRLSSALANTR